MKTRLYTLLFAGLAFTALLAFKLLDQDPLLSEIKQLLHQYRYTTTPEKVYVHTDKSLYYPQENLWFSGYIAGASNRPEPTNSDVAYVELISPKGSVQKRLRLPIQHGKIKGDFKLGSTGGIYKLRAYTHWMKNFGEKAFFEKKIQVQRVMKPKLLLRLDFEKEKYGQGDTVTALFIAKDLKNQEIALQEFQYTVQLAGKQYQKDFYKTDKKGEAKLKFVLPRRLKSDDGLLNIIIQHDHQSASIARAVPIVLQNVQVQFMPEGGHWVKGVKSRVAFKAVDKYGKPVDVTGEIIDKNGTTVAGFSSFHQGMGAFELTPETNKGYRARLTQPVGITQVFTLPKVLKTGYTLQVQAVNQHQLKISTHRPTRKPLFVVVQSGGKVLFNKKIEGSKQDQQLLIYTQKFPVGVARVTLFDEYKTPQAERITFVNPHQQLNITLKTDKKQYKTREKVTLDIQTTNENQAPVSANLSLAVVDDKMFNLADDKQDNILSFLLMSSELKGEVYEPNFYFKKDEAKASQALDYVMMTHGWRSFAWKDVFRKGFLEKYSKEKLSNVSGTILNKRNNKPIKAYVTLFELKGKKRVVRLETLKDGRFLFQNIDPNIPMELHARSVTNRRLGCQILLTGEKAGNAQRRPNLPQKNKPAIQDKNLMNPENSAADQIIFGKNTGGNLANLNLQESGGLQEVVVTGLGVQQNARQLGIVAVKQVVRNGGYFIHGLLGKEPLYVLNGNIVNNSKILEHINPETIQEVYQIQPSSAVMMYGSKASQGALVINTSQQVKELTRYSKKAVERFSRPYARRYIFRTKRFSRARVFYQPVYGAPDVTRQRSDFRNTIYWNPEVVTNSKGNAKVSFYTSDALTSFRLIAEGMSKKGRIGYQENTIYTQLPLQLDVKIPPYLAVGDTIQIPVHIKNNSQQLAKSMLVVSSPLIHLLEERKELSLSPQGAHKVFLRGVVQTPGQGTLKVRVISKIGVDLVDRNFTVFSPGFPVEKSFSGNQVTNHYPLDMPEVMDKSLKVTLHAYPDIMGNLLDGIKGIIRKPYGCFEQTSSSTYPNIMALQLLKKIKQDHPVIRKRAMDYIRQGYKRLISYETSQRGFEWFGRTPPHEGLTAYGLMEFIEMSKVYQGVSKGLIKRTKAWLLSRRDGKGGFLLNKKRLDHFGGASQEVSNAYVIYALTFAGVTEIFPEYSKAYQEALQTKDAYRMALLALSATHLGRTQEAGQMIQELKKQLKRNGVGKFTAEHSMVRSGGASLQIETSALMVLAVLKQTNSDMGVVQKLIDYIISKRSYGRFGSTQGTILALKALVAYSQKQSTQVAEGQLLVYNNGQKIGTLGYIAKSYRDFKLTGLERYVKQGMNNIVVRFANQKQMIPFSLNISYYTAIPNSQKKCDIALNTSLAKRQVTINETARLTTTIRNKRRHGLPSTMALVGIPSGLSPQPWQLKELQEKGKIAYYEIKGTYVIFYFRQMAPQEVKTIHLDLKADVPGMFKAPASSAYLYYTNEYKDWQTGEHILIEPGEFNK